MSIDDVPMDMGGVPGTMQPPPDAAGEFTVESPFPPPQGGPSAPQVPGGGLTRSAASDPAAPQVTVPGGANLTPAELEARNKRCTCYCVSCAKGDHKNCSHIDPCAGASACGCKCGACKNEDHGNCTHVTRCKMAATTPPKVASRLSPDLIQAAQAPVISQEAIRAAQDAAMAEAVHAEAVRTGQVPPPKAGAGGGGTRATGGMSGTIRDSVKTFAQVMALAKEFEREIGAKIPPGEERNVVLMELAHAVDAIGKCGKVLLQVYKKLEMVERVTASLIARAEAEARGEAAVEGGGEFDLDDDAVLGAIFR